MSRVSSLPYRAWRYTALCGVTLAALAPQVGFGFNPNSSTTSAGNATHSAAEVPAAAPLPYDTARLNFFDAAPTVNANAATSPDTLPPATFPSAAPTVPSSAPANTATTAPATPAAEVAAPVAAAPTSTPTPVEAQAPQLIPAPAPMPAMAAAPELPPPPSPSDIAAFSAPAPLSAPVGAPAPAIISPPAMSTPVAPLPMVASTAPERPAPSAEQLSDASKKIISTIPSRLDSPKSAKGANKLDVSRMTPAVKDLVDKAAKSTSYDANGVSIKVSRPALDSNYELGQAYTALMGGDNERAITLYKNILTNDPNNQDALFGIASTYHRAGDIAHARPYYGRLLSVNPNHRDGLNNFLSLVGDEAPQEALAELDRLQERNPDFASIPAQKALLLSKLGYMDQAVESMGRAVELSPENLNYKYNLAIILDKKGDRENAASLYRMLIEASLKGGKVPASLDTMQKRLNYISSTLVAGRAPQVGG